MPALNLRAKLLGSVLAIILGTTAITVFVGSARIGERLRNETIAQIAGTQKNFLAAKRDIQTGLSQATRMMARSSEMRGAMENDDYPTAAFEVATVLENTQADSILWLHRSGKPAVYLERNELRDPQTGELVRTGIARLGESMEAEDLFAFDDGAGDEAVDSLAKQDQLAKLLNGGSQGRAWQVVGFQDRDLRAPLMRALQGLNERVSARISRGKFPADRAEEVIATFGNRLFFYSYRPVVREGGGYSGILAAGYEVEDAFASRISSLTRSELVFLRRDGEGAVDVLGYGAPDGKDHGEADGRRSDRIKQHFAAGRLVPGSPPATMEFDGQQYVVLAGMLDVLEGSDQAAWVIGGNLTARLGILEHLKQTLVAVSGVAAFLALSLLSLGMGYWVNRPVERLAEGMRRIQAGDLGTEIPVQSGDEMGQLADSYNQMLVELQKKEQYMKMVSKSAVAAVETSVSADLKAGGERRDVTVFFSDIRGFTSLSERIDPNELVVILNRYFDAMVGIIYKHGGLLDKFIGDAIMAIWEGEDHARRAVLASLEMMEEARRLDREEELGIKIGIGLHSGEVVAGFVGAREFMNHTYLGDTVNVAARLEGVSKNGRHTKIIISEATYESVPGLVEVEQLELDKVKGKAEAVHMYEVVRLCKNREIFADLSSPDPALRRRAATLLGRLAGADAIPQLLDLTGDADQDVAVGALHALATLAAREVPLADSMARVKAIAEDGAAPRIRSAVLHVVAAAGDSADLAYLGAYLRDPDSRVRADAVEAVRRIEQVSRARTLVPLLEDPSNRVKGNAAMALFETEPDLVADHLCRGLRSADPRQRATSAYAIWSLAERFPAEARGGAGDENLGAKIYRRYVAFQRLQGALAAQVSGERDERVLRHLFPALRFLMGLDSARQLISDVFDEDEQEQLRQSGVLSLQHVIQARPPPEEDDDADPGEAEPDAAG